MDGLDDVSAGADSVANVNAAAYARVHVFDGGQDVEGRRKNFVFRAVVVDGESNVVLHDEFFYEGKNLGPGIAGDDDGDAGALAVIEFGADIVFAGGGKIDGSGGV